MNYEKSTQEQRIQEIENNIKRHLDSNPKAFMEGHEKSLLDSEKSVSATIFDRERSIGCLGYQYFETLETFDEAFEYFRTKITERDNNSAFDMIDKMLYFFKKAFYQGQCNFIEKREYDTNVEKFYRQIFREERLASCLADFHKDGDIFWDWAVVSLKMLGYE